MCLNIFIFKILANFRILNPSLRHLNIPIRTSAISVLEVLKSFLNLPRWTLDRRKSSTHVRGYKRGHKQIRFHIVSGIRTHHLGIVGVAENALLIVNTAVLAYMPCLLTIPVPSCFIMNGFRHNVTCKGRISCNLLKVKIKLSLCFIKHYVMKMCGEWRYSSTILDLGTRRGRFTPGTHCIGGWVGPRTGLEIAAYLPYKIHIKHCSYQRWCLQMS
jgi:hypothetical protein